MRDLARLELSSNMCQIPVFATAATEPTAGLYMNWIHVLVDNETMGMEWSSIMRHWECETLGDSNTTTVTMTSEQSLPCT
jgi:hypothetical protein